jgi:methylase of polypeptide subunit release factors
LKIKSNIEQAVISWEESGKTRSAHWRSENGVPAPKRVVIADDSITADAAYRLACEGTAILWRGDFQNARQLLQAMSRRLDHKPRRSKRRPPKPDATPAAAFHLYRQAQSQRARTLAMLLLPLDADYSIPLRRAPNVRQACIEVYGPSKESSREPSVVSLREVLGLIGAHEWRKKGVDIPALGNRIHPHYGVFSPVRGEYVDLVAEAPLPSLELAFDIGTGTGVLAAVLAKRGVKHIVATDQDAKALACARENIARLNLSQQVEVVQADLFPKGKAPLIVCNPPWVPARPSSPLEHAIYDPESRMLHGFLSGLAEHLEPKGEAWLILSDFAEHLGLRTRDELLAAIASAGLKVVDRIDVKPKHPKTTDAADPLHSARVLELTSLWRLAAG